MYNPYSILGVSTREKKADIKIRYKKLAVKYHPDNLKTGDSSKFLEVSKAWEYINKNHIDLLKPESLKDKGVCKHKTLFSIKEV